MGESRRTSIAEAQRVGVAIGLDSSRFDLEQFRAGMDVEYEHGSHDLPNRRDWGRSDPHRKIALARTNECPDYYERLERIEREAEAERLAKCS